MTLPANIRVNVRAPFPTQVNGAAFITVAKKNGVWTITPDYSILNPNNGLSVTQVVAVMDTATGLWSQISSQSFGSLSLSRTITVAGVVVVLSTDVVLLLNKSPSGASTIDLPAASLRNGAPVVIKDLTGDASTNNITIVPNGTETIDGFLAAAAAANGVALIDKDYGSKYLLPTTGGWFTL